MSIAVWILVVHKVLMEVSPALELIMTSPFGINSSPCIIILTPNVPSLKGGIIMASNKNLHLTLDERILIEKGIAHGATKSAIAEYLGKDNSTIGKEIKSHRHLSYPCSYPRPCANAKSCSHDHLCHGCPDFTEFQCPRRDRSPGACNGCEKIVHCRYDKFKYSADLAQKEYQAELVDSRLGVNLNPERLQTMAEIVVPLIKAGQSPYQIITHHPELGISKKTLYNYIEEGVFRSFGLLNIDLRIKVKRKITKKKEKVILKQRKDRKYLQGRTYHDFLAYSEANPQLSIVEMDTVYNDEIQGPFLQTFKFLSYSFMLILYHERKTTEEMLSGIDFLENLLGNQLFAQEFAIMKTDRGSEFVKAEEMEKEVEGSRRTRIFYCDPMASGQKGSLENNHKELRYICPKNTNLRALGLDSQKKANLIASHINSQPKEKLKGKSPLEMMKFMNEPLYKKLIQFGIQEIDKDKIILKPYVLKTK